MKEKFIRAYLDIAQVAANLSYSKRLKVGAIVVKDHQVISIGYNGTPPGMDNSCDFEEYCPRESCHAGCGCSQDYPLRHADGRAYRLVTRPEVIHAEENAIAKLAKSSIGGQGADLFVTHSPCFACSRLILSSGIKKVIYSHHYRITDGLDLLGSQGVEVVHFQG